MQNMRIVVAVCCGLILSGCSVFDGLVYRIDVPQGNYLEQRDVDQLRVGMNKAQVEYVLGAPVAASAFNSDTWHYVFSMNSGTGAASYTQHITLRFENDQLVSYEGDFERPENFDIPLEQ